MEIKWNEITAPSTSKPKNEVKNHFDWKWGPPKEIVMTADKDQDQADGYLTTINVNVGTW